MPEWVSWLVFSLRLLVRYGPALIELGQKIYESIERVSQQRAQPMLSREKQELFDIRARSLLERHQGVIPTQRRVAEFRQDMWTKANWHKSRLC